MTSRSRKCRLAGLALVAVIGVSGCTFHPGSAALVNSTKISQNDVDDLVVAACSFTRLNRLANPAPSEPASAVAFFKHLFTQDLVSFAIVEKAARQQGVTVSPAAIGKIVGQQPLPAGLSDSDESTLTDFFTASARSQLQQIVIAAHLADPSVTSTEDVDEADYQKLLQSADAYMARYTKQQSVQINPSYGSWDGGAVGATDGSLSAPASEVAAKWLRLRTGSASDPASVSGLPPNQVCG